MLRPRMRLLALPFALTFAIAAPNTKAAELTVDPSTPQTVFSWSSQRCDDIAIPDSPARALRLPDGRLLLVATHYNNRVLVGSGFADLKPDCRTAGAGQESADPAMFDDRFWVQALLPARDGRVLGLASHEFHGKRHEGSCSLDRTQRVRCWYSSIVAVEAPLDHLGFRLLPLKERVVVAPPARYSPDGPARYGIFTVSNIVRHGDYFYAAVYQEGMGGKRSRGNCLLRAPQSDPLKWKVLAEDGGWIEFANPYRSDEPDRGTNRCAVIGEDVFSQAIRSLIFIEPWQRWVAVSSKRSGGPDGGVYYATSTDLLEWTKPRLLLSAIEPWADRKGCGTYFAYPSLIDHKSRSELFDTGGDDVWLYLTRFNFANCVKGLNRDLVRYKVTVR